MIVGLVGRHARLYHTSPTFKGHIDYLAGLLPLLIDALADTSVLVDDQIKMATEISMRTPLNGPQLRDIFGGPG